MFLAFLQIEAQATHLRAGDITAKRDTTPNPNPRRFFFTMIIYTNQDSNAEDPQVTISTGVGNETIVVQRGRVTSIGNRTDREEFKWEYTYPGDGNYTVSWTGENRNDNILNLAAPSLQHSFFLSTTISVNALRGFNSTPVLRYPPIDFANVGRQFVHNPGAYDADGDSLSFKFTTPKRRDVNNNVITVPGYQLPSQRFTCNNSTDSGISTMTLDPITGQLVWDAPCVRGEYNVAFVIEEWRVSPNGGAVKLGEVVRDMQILVREGPNRPPVLEPKDTCVVAGTVLEGIIRATDPDNDLITLTAISGILPPATFRQITNTAGLATGEFRWATECADVRQQPYQVLFRAEDMRPDAAERLVGLQPWNITVVGPPPENLVATGQGKDVALSWDPYVCRNASAIRIYRREGPSGFEPGECQTGIPGSTGYALIAEVGADQVGYLDNNGGRGLESGKEYCYMI
ncbi:gliding motility-associated C-terminal domain-containing protein, partial [Pontibacter sp. 13R65]